MKHEKIYNRRLSSIAYWISWTSLKEISWEECWRYSTCIQKVRTFFDSRWIRKRWIACREFIEYRDRRLNRHFEYEIAEDEDEDEDRDEDEKRRSSDAKRDCKLNWI
jgi:hypothetical protein